MGPFGSIPALALRRILLVVFFQHAVEIGSMRDALKHALDLGMVLETTATPASREFDEILRTQGVRAALEWREEKLGHHGRVMRHEIG